MQGLIGKVWGTTQLMLATPTFEIHHLIIKPNMRCSLHAHERKWNAFAVVSGLLYIDVHKKDYPLVDTTELAPGKITTVKPGENHMFRTGEDGCEAFELYYVDTLSEDIQRKDHGGPIEITSVHVTRVEGVDAAEIVDRLKRTSGKPPVRSP